MSRLKKTIASGAVAAFSSTGAFMALGGHAAHASTNPVSLTFPMITVTLPLITTFESFLGDIRYDCSLYAMTEMLDSYNPAGSTGETASGNFGEAYNQLRYCGYLAGYGNFGFGLMP